MSSLINRTTEYIILAGIINKNNIFNSCYLLIFSNSDAYIKNFQNDFNQPYGFEKFLYNFKFNNIYECQQINDKMGSPSGLIINLIKTVQNLPMNQNNLLI